VETRLSLFQTRPSFQRPAAALRAGLAIVAASGLVAMASPARADTASPALIVVDGSGSMWGKMEGDDTAKFYGARDFLRDLLGRAPPQSRIGLASFGHRRKADCSDVEIIAPVEAGGKDGVVAALEQLNPKGKGPVSAALREGAKTLGAGMPGHIILVHDNLDNCGQDLCAAAAEVAKSNPALKVHVLSLGLSKPDRDRVQCVAKATGGTQFHASNQAEIGAALSQAFRIAGLDAAAAPLATPAAPVPPAAPQGPPGLRLTASMAEGGGMIDGALDWRVTKAGGAADEPPLVERRSREINETLPPGSYAVTVTHGLISRAFTIDVADGGPTVKRVALEGGLLKVAASASRQGDKLAAPVMTVAAITDGDDKAAAPLWIGREAQTQLIVPAGKYVVDVTDGLARARNTVEIAPGGVVASDLVLETGRLELTATGVAGGAPLDRVLYLVAVDDPNAPQGRREIARSTAPAADFTLQAGTYYVTARHGTSEIRERVAISSGDFVKKTLVLDVARLIVKPTPGGAAIPSDLPVVTRVYETEGGKRLVGQSTAGEPAFVLGAGRYRVEAQAGTSNIRKSLLITLAAGKDTSIAVPLEAGEIAVGGLPVAASPASVQAAIRDTNGRIVWRSRAGSGLRAVVAPGDYVLLLDSAAGRSERSISLKAGERREVDFASP
jgi:Ca-activated chloride channel family protein